MAMTLVGLFDKESDARRASEEIQDAGIARGPVRLSSESGSDVSSMLSTLEAPRQDVEIFEEGIRRGGTLLTVPIDEDAAGEADRILQNRGVIDLEGRQNEWRSSGWTGSSAVDTGRGEVSLPVVEEELRVGKRPVQQGRVRVYTRTEETPVEEQVRLREERVTVDRRPTDRPVTEADMQTLKGGTIEVSEMAEEAVVSKQARVVEEVVIGKEVNERTETVRDTVRNTEVEVDESDVDRGGFDAFDADFRNNFDSTFAKRGYTYEQYMPAYRYGYNLANDSRYQNKEWSAVEASARSDWERHNQGTWEDFKDAIRNAWDTVRGRSRVHR